MSWQQLPNKLTPSFTTRPLGLIITGLMRVVLLGIFLQASSSAAYAAQAQPSVSATEAKPAGRGAVSEQAPESSQPKTAAPAVNSSSATQPAVSAEQGTAGPQPVGRRPKAEGREIIEALEGISVLTPKGTLVVQPSLEYSHSSANRVLVEGFTIIPAITVGLIDARRIDRDSLIASLSLRYGLSKRLEVETSLPFAWRADTTMDRQLEIDSSQDEIVDIDGSGFGDLTLGLRYQLNQGQRDGAFHTANLRVKSHTGKGPFEVATNETGQQTELPTGSGFWGIEAGLTSILPSDPVVFFSNLSYLRNLSRSFGQVGKIEPGHTIAVSLGMGVTLNEKVSFSLGYEHSVVGKSKQNGQTIKGSQVLQVGSLLLGASYKLQKNRRLNLSLSAGLTEDAPDVRLVLRVPTSFDLLK